MATSDEREPPGSMPASRPDLLALEVRQAVVTLDAVQAGPAPQHRASPVPGALRPIAEAPGISSARAISSPTPGDPRAAAPPAGAMIGRYEIIRPLASGGMGQVLLSRDTRLGRLAALKLLLMSQGAEQAARFLAEAFATARLNHENIVVIYEVGEHEGHPFMALEYLKGQTLRQWIDERKATRGDAGLLVPPRAAIELMLPVVRALVHAHERGIAHRDLKPENVMLTDAGTLKVLDFGIAKILAEAEDARISLESIPPDWPLTQTGGALGTILYMAPEQWGVDAVDHRADLWAAGLMLYELLFGESPLAPLIRGSQSIMELLRRLRDVDTPLLDLQSSHRELGALGALIDRCLIKRKDGRIGSAAELLAELTALLPAYSAASAARDEDQNPFAGLSAFQEADAARFFGREGEIAGTTARLRTQPLVAVAAPSGAGKSSFVRAGVIPALKRSGEPWEAFILRPGRRPLAALAEVLARISEPAPVSAPVNLVEAKDPDALAALLRDRPGLAGAWLRAHCRQQGSRHRILLFVDQFEELYTLGTDPDERAAFVASLESAADDASSPLRVLLSIRSDFFDRMAENRNLMIEVTRGLIFLPPMGRDGLREALTRPIEAAGYRFESEDMILGMLGAIEAIERTRSPLPLLQFTAAMLWEVRDRKRRLLTRDSYEKVGGVAGALSTHADAVVAGLSSLDQRLCRAVFRRLVTPERTRALATLGELRDLGGPTAADMDRVLGRLIEARLLTVDGSSEDDSTVEIVHESLLEQWPLLAKWLDEEQDDARLVARLRGAAKDWEASDEADGLLWRGQAAEQAQRWYERHRNDDDASPSRGEERYLRAVIALSARARRARRRVIAGIIAGLVVATASTSYLAWQESLAKRAAEQAILRTRDAARLAAARQQSQDPTAELALLRDIEGSEPPAGWAADAKYVVHAGVARAALEGHAGGVNDAAFSPDGRRIVSGSEDRTVRVWNADGLAEPLVLRGHTATVTAVAVSPDGRRIASASWDKTVRVWNADGSGQPLVLQGHNEGVSGAAWSPDGSRIASASDDTTVLVWNADGSGRPLALRGHTEAVYKVAFSPDGNRIASISRDKTVRIWNADGSGQPLVLRGHADHVRGLAWSPDGSRIASASVDKTVRVWNADGSGQPLVLRGHTSIISSVGFSPDGGRIVSASDDRTVRVWNSDDTGRPLVLRHHTERLWSVAVSPDGSRIASASDDMTVRIVNADGSGQPLVLEHPGVVWSVAFSPDGRRVASACEDAAVRVWNADGPGQPLVLRGHTGPVRSVAFSPDGRRIASGSLESTVHVWSADGSGQPLVFRGHTGAVCGTAFSPDGRRIASAHQDTTVWVWNADGSGQPLVLREHTAGVCTVAFSPDGSRIASGSQDETLRVWNADGSGRPVVLRGHTDVINGVAFSPDGRRIASASNDKTVRVWNADGSGQPVMLLGHTELVVGVAWSPEGRSIASASFDTTVRVWRDLDPITPDDPLLWTLTTHCLSIARQRELLGVSEEVAGGLRERCLRRVAQASVAAEGSR